MADIPDPDNSTIIGQKSYFNEKATFFGGIEVFGGAIEGETGKKLGTGTGDGTGKGPQGVQGPLSNYQGTQGAQGTQGNQGMQGSGSQGAQGTQGPLSNFQGTQGLQGLQGNQGLQGLSNQGVQGNQGLQGNQGNQGLQGLQGLQGPPGNFQGTQGAQGNQGRQGTQGTQGNQGLQGTQGNQGVRGNQGSQGVQGKANQGVQGTQGLQGDQGTQGLQGVQGRSHQGVQGTQGLQGEQGTQGLQGTQGRAHQGTQGPQGTQGLQGTQGNQGLSNQGVQGNQGNQGLQGSFGVQGNQGTQGSRGHQGSQGTQGAQGIQGIQGLKGSPGEGSRILIDDTDDFDEKIFIGLSTSKQASATGITSLTVSSNKLVFLPSSGSLGVGTSSIATVDGDNVSLTVSGIATADSYRGDGANLVGIVTQLVSGIGIDLDPANGKGKVTVTSYKPTGKTIFVAQNGDDSNTGLSENHPKRTIKNAAEIATTGDTVKVFPGVYVENNPIILNEKTAVEGTELRNCIVTPQNGGSDLFHVNNGCHVTDLSFVGSASTNGASVVAFQPLAGVSTDRFFDGARMIRINLDFIAKQAVGYLTSTDYKNPAFSLSSADITSCVDDVKDVFKAVCFDITRGGNSKCVGAGKSYYNGSNLLHINGTDLNGYSIKDATIDTMDYAIGIARSCVNNQIWYSDGSDTTTVNEIELYSSSITQVRDLSIQVDSNSSPCANVLSAVTTCVGITTDIIEHGLNPLGRASSPGITTTYPADYNGQTTNNYGDKMFGADDYSPGVGVIDQGPYIRNCTNFIGNSIGMKVDGFHAEPGDENDNGVTGSMSVDSYTQYNQNGIGVSISNGAYAQLVSIFTICNDIGHWATGGGQCDITNSNCSFGNKGLVCDGVGDENSRSIYRYTGEIVNEVAFDSDNPDRIEVSGIGSLRPYDGQAIYIGELYYEVSSVTVTDGGSSYDEDNPPVIVLDDPTGPNGITAELSANVDATGKVTSIDVINTGSQYLTTPSFTITQNGGSNLAFTVNISPIYYGIESATKPTSEGKSTIVLLQNLNNTVSAGSTVYFTRSSLQLASTISLEWVGSGTDINSARPGLGGVAILDNEFVRQNGGRIIFTGTNQAGDFKIGPDVTINQLTGTISGRAFNQSLLNTVTPLIIALG
jgi:hypothetical protein